MGDDEDKRRLYVGSLNYSTDDGSLKEFFEKHFGVADGKRNLL